MFEKDIALKIEVMEDGIGRTITVPQEQLAKINVLNPVRKKKKKAKDKLLRPKNYMCGECGIGFVSSKDLNRHRVVHTGREYPPRMFPELKLKNIFVCRREALQLSIL